jgi:hypothetical protein
VKDERRAGGVLADYAAGTAAFDITMAALIGVVAFGYLEVLAAIVWIALVARACLSRQCEPVPRATVIRSSLLE